MSEIHNERTKLTANWLNIVGAGTIIAGAITPMAAIVYGLRAADPLPFGAVIALTVVWILAGFALHLLARFVLRSLRE